MAKRMAAALLAAAALLLGGCARPLEPYRTDPAASPWPARRWCWPRPARLAKLTARGARRRSIFPALPPYAPLTPLGARPRCSFTVRAMPIRCCSTSRRLQGRSAAGRWCCSSLLRPPASPLLSMNRPHPPGPPACWIPSVLEFQAAGHYNSSKFAHRSCYEKMA